MASTPTASNRFVKQGTGDNPGTWGAALNTQAIDLVDESLDGVTSVTVNAPVTLSSSNYATDQARKRILKCSGAGDAVTVPSVPKWYVVHNLCTGAVTIKTSAGAGASVAPGAVTFVYCDGTTCLAASNMWPIINGSAGVPSLSFASDSDTGLYRITANALGISAGGARIMEANTAGIVVTGLITNTDNVATTKSANTSLRHVITNSNSGAAAETQFIASNGTDRIIVGRRGSQQTAAGSLSAGAGYVYSDNRPLVLFAAGADGRLVVAAGDGEISRAFSIDGTIGVLRLGRAAYNFSSSVAGLSIGYAGVGTQYGIALRPQADHTTPLLMENAAGSAVGSITQSNTAVAYNTASDYRLKGEIVDLKGSGAFIDALRPREWRWASSGERGAGFVAHEASGVSPSSVTGEKDAIGADGRPLYQGMMAGSAEIIANLVAQVQELRARLSAIEAAE